MDRVILHSDINSCYASVERLYKPELEGKPFAVCGSQEMRHGIVLAKDETAKRAGVKTGMAIWQARQLCPELEVVEPHFERYTKYSAMVREIYAEYTDLCEPFGILGIYLAHHRGIFRVSLKVRLNDFKLGAQLPRLPYSHAGLYPGAFCRFILCKHYAVAHFLRAANRKGLSLKLGLIQPLDARVARIYIRMKYHSVHRPHLRLR